MANGFDQLVKQINTQRAVGAHGPDVKQRAAQREFAGRRHLADAGVAGAGKAQSQGLDLEFRAALEVETARRHEIHRRQARDQAVGRQQQDAAAQPRQARQRAQAFGDDVRMRREDIVGQDFPVWQRQQFQLRSTEEAQFGAQPLEVADIGAHKGQRTRLGRGRFGQCEGAGAAMQRVPVNGGAGHRGQRRPQ